MAKLLLSVAAVSAAVLMGGFTIPHPTHEQATQALVRQAKAEIDAAPKPVTAIPERRYEPPCDDSDADRAAVL